MLRKTHICSPILLIAGTPVALADPMAASPANQMASSSSEGQQPADGVQTADANPNQVGDIVVTAQKRSESINKVGISITALGSDALAKQGISNTADLVKAVPGFNFTPSAYGAPVFTLRGIGFYDVSLAATPTVSLYVDEVPLPISFMAQGTTLDLERVEVLKGPQGTLFGQNSTGGAINYIAAKPTSRFAAGLDGTYGRFDRTALNGFVSGPLSDTLRVRLAARYDRAGDWQRSYTRDDTLGRTNLLVGRLLVDWRPTSRLTVSLNANGWRDRSDNQAAQLVKDVSTSPTIPAALRNYPLPPADDRAADWDPNTAFRRNLRFWQTSVRVDYEFSDIAKLTSITAYEDLRRRSYVDADGTAFQAFAVNTPGSTRDFSQELRLSGSPGAFRYVLGANYTHDRIHDEGNPYSPTSSFPFTGALAKDDQRAHAEAAFGNIDWRLSRTVTLLAGARYTDQHRSYSGCTYDGGDGRVSAILARIASTRLGRPVVIPPGTCVTLGPDNLPGLQHTQLNEDNVSWRGGVNWQATPGSLLYANVSKGYKAGSFPTSGANFYQSLRPARQESVLAYEAGAKLTLLDRTLQLNGAAFYYDYSNKQVRGKVIDPVSGPLNQLINIPKSSVTGAELSAVWRPLAGLVVNVGGTLVDSKIKNNFTNYDAIGQVQDFEGQHFPLVPKWQVVGDAEYDVAVSSRFSALLGGGFNYQDKTNGGLGELPLFAIPQYTLVDLRVGLFTPDNKWRATFYVRNVGDKYYWTLVNFPGVDTVIKYAGQPRTYGLTIARRF